MNPAQHKIQRRLDSFPPELRPLTDASQRYLKFCSAIDVDETALIAHQPWKAPLAYAFHLYPPAKEAWFSKFEKIHQVAVPAPLRPVLRTFSGCFAFGISLFGISPSMLQSPPLISRRELQCHNLATANTHWKFEYKVDENAFHFGGRAYSSDENSGYFLYGKSTVLSILKDGSIVGQWDNFTSFLMDELAASEDLEFAKIPSDWWH